MGKQKNAQRCKVFARKFNVRGFFTFYCLLLLCNTG